MFLIRSLLSPAEPGISFFFLDKKKTARAWRNRRSLCPAIKVLPSCASNAYPDVALLRIGRLSGGDGDAVGRGLTDGSLHASRALNAPWSLHSLHPLSPPCSLRSSCALHSSRSLRAGRSGRPSDGHDIRPPRRGRRPGRGATVHITCAGVQVHVSDHSAGNPAAREHSPSRRRSGDGGAGVPPSAVRSVRAGRPRLSHDTLSSSCSLRSAVSL